MELPKNFLDSMKELLGEEYDQYLNSFHKKSFQGIRVNTNKISVEEFVRQSPFLLRPVPWVKNGFYVERDAIVTKHPYYYAGLYYVQEPSAMLPASRLPIEPGDKVLDLCAAPGGKATELGSRLKGTGLLVANDISNSRAKGLLKNLELFGIGNMLVTSEAPEKLLKYYRGYFDKILIDAPCSGEGMFRKDASILKAYQVHGPEYYAEIQKNIVNIAVQLLKPTGSMLFSTCTFSKLENEGTVEWLLNTYPELKLQTMESCEGFVGEKCIRIFPHRVDGEGHFAALISKTELSLTEKPAKAKTRKETKIEKKTLDGKLPRAWKEFVKNYLRRDFRNEQIVQIGEKLYALPRDTEIKDGIRYLRTGLFLGTLKKERFEPSQALAMNLRKDECRQSISLEASDERVLRYLKGETLELGASEANGIKGWCLVCVDGYPLGWAKYVDESLRNKYYAGWRIG